MTGYWLKLYVELLNDPKTAALSDHHWRRFIEFLLLAKEHNAQGTLPDVKDMAWRLRATDEDVLAALKMLEMVSVDEDGRGIVYFIPEANRWIITHFAERQAPMPDKVRKQLSRKRHAEVTKRDATVTSPVTKMSERRGEEEDRGEERGRGELRPADALPTFFQSLGLASLSFEGPQAVYKRTLENILARAGLELATQLAFPIVGRWENAHHSPANLGWVPELVAAVKESGL